MLKRAGHGLDSQGASNTRSGECAVSCPACPHPGKNLPEDWRDAPQAKRYVVASNSIVHYFYHSFFSWLYALFVAIDANFRLKCKDVSKDEVDPSLGDGWAYFVKHKDYKTYLTEHTSTVQEVRAFAI
jgi:hypothetical protein